MGKPQVEQKNPQNPVTWRTYKRNHNNHYGDGASAGIGDVVAPDVMGLAQNFLQMQSHCH